MPNSRPSSDLYNKYNEISNYCHESSDPVYITKDGKADLAVMSIEAYEKLVARFELGGLLDEGIDDTKKGKVRPFREALNDIQRGNSW